MPIGTCSRALRASVLWRMRRSIVKTIALTPGIEYNFPARRMHDDRARLVTFIVFGGLGVAMLFMNRHPRAPQAPGRPRTVRSNAAAPTSRRASLRFPSPSPSSALIFLLFDIEAAFFFPWALVLRARRRAGVLALPLSWRCSSPDSSMPGRKARSTGSDERRFPDDEARQRHRLGEEVLACSTILSSRPAAGWSTCPRPAPISTSTGSGPG